MKKFFTGMIVLAFSASVFAIDPASYRPLNGSVKSIVKTDYEISSKFGEYFRTPVAKLIEKYDSDGNIVESSEYTPRDVLKNRLVYKYDDKQNLSETTCFDSENVQIWTNVNTYKNGKLVDSSEFGKGGVLKGRTIYNYLDEKTIDESYYNGTGELVWKSIIIKNSKNLVDVEDDYFATGLLNEERKYTYNSDGLIENILYYNDHAVLLKKDVFRYTNKLLSEIITYSPDNKPLSRRIIKSDSKGNVVKITDYNVANKFGSTVNEMVDLIEFSYEY